MSPKEVSDSQPLALDSLHNFKVRTNGLELEETYYFSRGVYVPSSHRFGLEDTAFFMPVIEGYGVADGKVSVGCSYKIYNAEGKLLRDVGDMKTVERIDSSAASHTPFMLPMQKLDSLDKTSPYYDVTFALKDRITGKSAEGIFRIRADRP